MAVSRRGFHGCVFGRADSYIGMRIILSDFISLDGVVQAPGGQEEDTDGGFRHGGWSMPFFDDDAMGPVLGEVMAQTEALLFGRRTWEVMASAWPERGGDPFADQMNTIRKFVVSRTLTAAEASSRWSNTTLIGGEDALATIGELRDRDGAGAVQVMGSASLAVQLVENDLVDEYRLMLEPILLGGGKTIFPRDGRARPLELVAVTEAKTGVLICAYRPATV
jgi:dihydrofolate reductase